MKRKKTAVVPRAVMRASFGGVVPACVVLGLQACSNSGPVLGVAAVAYCCFEAGLNDGDADAAKDAVATDAGEGGDGSESGDSGDAAGD